MKRTFLSFSSNGGIEGSITHDLTFKLIPDFVLDERAKYCVAVDSLPMSYSWYNISTKYNNNKLKYSADDGLTWNTITFPEGNFDYQDLDLFIMLHVF